MPYKFMDGKWTYVATSDDDLLGAKRPEDLKHEYKSEHQSKPKDNDNRETTTTKEKSDREYKDIEINILEGKADIIPNPKVHAKGTVRLEGVGTQLTGLYYVESSKHSFNLRGYDHTLTLTREGFGDSIKDGVVSKPGVTHVDSNGRPKPQSDDDYILINKWGTVTPRIGLNVRTSPHVTSDNSNKIGAMTCGTRVFCIGKKGAWYDHQWNGNHAWSHGNYIRLDD